MIPNIDRQYAFMVIGSSGGGNCELYGYLQKKEISAESTDLRRVIAHILRVEKLDDVFEYKGTSYRLASESKWEKFDGTNAGENLVALCKDETPLLITRHYSLAYEDSQDDTEYHQGPSGDEAYLFNEDTLAQMIYESMRSVS
jgi:hypothetical protein